MTRPELYAALPSAGAGPGAPGRVLCGLFGAALSGVVGLALTASPAPGLGATASVASTSAVVHHQSPAGHAQEPALARAGRSGARPAYRAEVLPQLGGLRPFLVRGSGPLDGLVHRAPVVLPAPLPIDPAVERSLARLRAGAGRALAGLRAAPAALGALDDAFAMVGRPYVWGATGPDAFDCSGLTQHAYGAVGVALPRVSRDQHAYGGAPVAVDDLLPGDLVFFATDPWDPGVVHHVGMYAGSGLMVAAPRPGLHVRVEPMPAQAYVGAVRVVPALRVDADHANDATPRRDRSPTKPSLPPVPPLPAATPNPSPTQLPTPAPEPTPTSAQPTPTASPEATPIPTAAPTATPTPEPTPMAEPTATPTETPTPEVTPTAAVLPLLPATVVLHLTPAARNGG